jgi:uracil-DNA glycosylase
MDETTRKEIAAYLEFYEELGMEGFYRRDSSTAALLPGFGVAKTAPPELVAQKAASPAPVVQAAPAFSKIPTGHSASPPPPVQAIRPPAPTFNLFEAAPAPRSGPETLEQIRGDLGDCKRCKLAPTRKTIVFGEGSPRAQLMFIGEGPGADEDEQGLPFVGRAGRLLNRMMETVGIKRAEVYICNVVKCRPPGNRTPEKDEVDACSPFLYRQIESVKPRLICCLGAPAVRTVLGIKEGITKIRGRFYDFAGTKALATVHPAYILRNPREEKILREDFEKIRDFLKGA